MKKKGLIISTVVMVVVLIASLTTATYAWFTTSASTSISGFDVAVVAGNTINIGLKGANYNAGTSADEFVSGSCAYVPGTNAFGSWTGDASLSPTISDTGVYWGEQSKAVGFTATKLTAASEAKYDNVGYFTDGSGSAIKANGSGNTLTSPEFANENGAKGETGTTYGDYAYLFIGAQATKALKANTNKFYIVV